MNFYDQQTVIIIKMKDFRVINMFFIFVARTWERKYAIMVLNGEDKVLIGFHFGLESVDNMQLRIIFVSSVLHRK